MRPETTVLRELLEAVYSVCQPYDDCDDCGDKSEAGNDEPCAVHRSSRLFHAVVATEQLLGPCQCGHQRSDHWDEDTTKCRECDCEAFRLPAAEPPA